MKGTQYRWEQVTNDNWEGEQRKSTCLRFTSSRLHEFECQKGDIYHPVKGKRVYGWNHSYISSHTDSYTLSLSFVCNLIQQENFTLEYAKR